MAFSFFPTASARHPSRAIVVCAALLAVLIVVAAAYILTGLRARALAENERQLANTSFILAKHVEHMFDAVEAAHKDLAESFSASWIGSDEHFERHLAGYDVHSTLKDKKLGLPYVGSLNVFNPRGRLVGSSRQWPAPDIDAADRDFFQVFQSARPPAFFLGRPVRTGAGGNWVMHLARPIESPDGRPIGLMTAAIELDYLVSYLEGLALTPDSAIALFRQDGMLLLRHPVGKADIGEMFGDAVALRLAAGGGNGIGQGTGVFDGRPRLVAAHRVAGEPVVIGATRTVAGALADWQRTANYIMTGAAIAVLCVIGFACFLIRSFRRHQELVRMRAEQAEAERIRGQNARFDAALNNMSHGLTMFDATCRLVVCNDRYLQMYGLTREEVRPGDTLLDIVRCRQRAGSFVGDPERYCQEVLASLDKSGASHVQATADGRTVHIVNRRMAGGGWVGTHEDISERVRAERERDRNRRLLDLVVDNVPATIVVKDARDSRYVLINRAGEKYYGVARGRMIGRTAEETLPPASAELVGRLDQQMLAANGAATVDEHVIEMPNGTVRTSVSTRLPILDEGGEPQYLLTVVNDVTEQRRAEARIVHMAHHDALTDLPNRARLREILERELLHARHGRGIAVHYLDLDNFKSVNDTLGHTAGDELIKIVAGRMRACLRNTDTIARFGGDEFVIVQTEVAGPLDAAELAQAVRAAVVAAPADVGGHQVVIDVSIGIALAPDDSEDAGELLKYADMALYGAKADGRGTYHFFEPKLDARMKSRRGLESDLRRALGGGEFELHYQPVVAIADNRISGFEALLRWRHPERGPVPPAEFIPVAEETGLIVPLGEWVLREACAEAARWPEPLRVSVNISPLHFIGQNLVPTVVAALAAAGLAPDRLEIEITEAVLLQSTERTLSTMRSLRELGVRIAMDDFGVGYSSLSYLRNFPFNKIKIDRSFIQDMVEQESARSIVRAVIALGTSLGMTTTAEGIETGEQLEVLRAEGCDEMQGYLFSAPRPAAEVGRLFFARGASQTSAAA